MTKSDPKNGLTASSNLLCSNSQKAQSLCSLDIPRAGLVVFDGMVERGKHTWMLEEQKLQSMANETESRRLVSAVRAGELAAIDIHLKNGADVNYATSDGSTAVYEAARLGNLEVLNKLIEAGADLQKGNELEITALMEVAAHGPLACLEKLLEAGADHRKRDYDGRTALGLAARGGSVAAGACLLRAGAFVDHADYHGRTPLMEAVINLQLEFMELLLDAGADVTREEEHGYTAFSFAVRGSASAHVAIALRLLQAKAAVDNLFWGRMPPHVGALLDSISFNMLMALFKAGVDPTLHFKDGTTLLHICVNHSSALMESIHQLMNGDPNIAAENMALAASLAINKTLKARIARGADVNVQDNDGTTMLHNSADHSSTRNESIEQLLIWADFNTLAENAVVARSFVLKEAFKAHIARGADVNVQDNKGCTVLMAAIKQHNLNLTRIILECSPDLDLADENSKTALLHALDLHPDQMINMAEMLLEAGADTEAQDAECKTALSRAIEIENDEVMDLLLNAGAQLERQDEDGSTALLVAVKLRQQTTVKKLLRRKAKTDTADKFGRTPLTTAVMKGDLPVVEMLLKAGADKEQYDSDLKTPLFIAVELNRRSIVEKLLAAGACATEKLGRSAIDVARNEPMKRLLQERAAKEAEQAAREVEVVHDDQSTELSCDIIGIPDGESLFLSVGP